MFALEALKARHGDCLLLHWGDAHVALIDGGPDRTYAEALAPRLRQLGATRGQKPLPLDLVMLSHIDDDHINGLLDLADAIEAGTAPATFDQLWFNSLEGLLDGALPGTAPHAATAAVATAFPLADGTTDPWLHKVAASVPQGQALHGFAEREGVLVNQPFDRLVLAGTQPSAATFARLTLSVVSPTVARLEALRTVWREKRKEGVTAAFSDRSPYNLSSIVVIAEFDDRSMLLTGDALGSDILEGLATLGRLDAQGRAHFDLLKLPHHGSRNNVEQAFFEAITADHYVVSGDHVKFPNPHEQAMGWLHDARGDDDYLVHCTYPLDYMQRIFGDRLRSPADGALGVTATLD